MSEGINVVSIDAQFSGDIHAVDLKLVCGDSAAALRITLGQDLFQCVVVQTPSPYPAEPEGG